MTLITPSSNATFDTPDVTDNREYDYTGVAGLQRAEYPVIADWIPAGSSVLDFGCGDGSLLRLLAAKGVRGTGWDRSVSGVEACRRSGLTAEVRDIDQRHPDVPSDSFDFAVCNVTIQMVMRPEILLAEMVRVARHQIVSFPNFAHWANRLDMLRNGRMPRPMMYGYKWYSTGHIHQLSVSDFLELVATVRGTSVIARKSIPVEVSGRLRFLRARFPNLFESIPVFLLGR